MDLASSSEIALANYLEITPFTHVEKPLIGKETNNREAREAKEGQREEEYSY